ncbi:hypothetical protein J7384_16890 [Endozoicomonas sp. G2_1]|uniref:hypothetical protein n=1 Tax=Endozoicomonas sp. G2_1 TaxID=2821091 RepID=UPI001ADC8176|nr:hypothetical protein [Endozoicomonas sp. G2_1]MBO9492040.1 hypothetical protein [Endozoicomonas sp. G2_1]
MNKPFKFWLFALISILVILHFAANIYAKNELDKLQLAPSPDLYVNNLSFQYFAFWLSYGTWITIGVVVVAVLHILLGQTHNKRFNGTNKA